MAKSKILAPPYVESKILEIRGERVMLDRDLAEVYGVTTGGLNQAIKRNQDRFPEDFVFRLTPGGSRRGAPFKITICDHEAGAEYQVPP